MASDKPGTRLAPALIAGQIASLGMLAVLLIVFPIVREQPALLWLRLIASLFVGRAALMDPAPLALVAAFFLHQLGPTVVWSLLFYAIVRNFRHTVGVAEALFIGTLLGAAAMLLDVYLLLPWVENLAYGESLWRGFLPSGWAWVAHLVFGAVLGVSYVRIRQGLLGRRFPVRGHRAPAR